jgi:4-hydroxy-4-methyl-2-oxoglutarate aldolase
MSSAEDRVFEPLAGDERLTAAMMSDSLDEAGYPGQVLRTRLAPLAPGSRALGRAITVQFAPSPEFDPVDPYREVIAFMEQIRPGHLVVVATADSNHAAFWGELFSAAALGAGAVGVVTDGNLRDTERIPALGFPAFCRSRSPLDMRGRVRVVASRRPVSLGGVEIVDGSLVIADDDGVAVVPEAAEADVLELARRRATTESTVLAELLAGSGLGDVWSRHRVL